MRHLAFLFLVVLFWPLSAPAEERIFRLSAPGDLVETGLLRHVLPRFTLKNGIRVTLVEPGEPAEARINFRTGKQAVFRGIGKTWYFDTADQTGPDYAQTFGDWLVSDVGKATVEQFQPYGTPVFTALIEQVVAVRKTVFEGDAALGEKLALTHCGRCHVINDSNRMKAIGSTPSFRLLRTLDDWDIRFQTFYTLNPHPAFTQIDTVTAPFGANTPSPIVPLQLTVEDLDAILAFVTRVPPADLGAPIQHQ